MQAVSFEDKILAELNEDSVAFDRDVRTASAIWFYRLHKLTLGQASQMACMSQHRFMLELSENGVPSIDYSASDLVREAHIG